MMNDENINEKKEKRKKIFEKMRKRIEADVKKERIINQLLEHKYIAIMFLSILFLLFFQIWAKTTPVYTGHIEMEPLISENKAIEQDIKNQILTQKAEEIGVKPINNPDIQDYFNLYIQKGTIIWDFTTNEQTTYNGVDVVVKAVKLNNGYTVFSINNKQYYIKE